MPEIALEYPALNGTFPHAVADSAVSQEGSKGVYFPFYCPIRDAVVGLIFHRTERTDRDGRPVYLLVGIKPMAEMQREHDGRIEEMKPATKTVQ